MEELAERCAHLWYVLADAIVDESLLAAYGALMTPEERARRDRFVFVSGQRECAITRALVRTTLSRYAPVLPTAWRFGVGQNGKPHITEPSAYRWLSFNLSHTKGLIACLVARDVAVGVDVEDCGRRGQTVEIAERYFAANEVLALRQLPSAEQRQRFFVYWTLKESYIKARGLGLQIPLGKFSFNVAAEGVALHTDADLRDDPGAWQFGLWRPSARHVGAWGLRRGDGPDYDVLVREVLPLRELSKGRVSG